MNNPDFFVDALVKKHSLLNLAVNDYHLADVIWNLFLLAIPLVLYALIYKVIKRSWRRVYKGVSALFLFLLWLIFIPNAPYIMTDVRHLLDYCPANYTRVCVDNAWMIMFFFLYGVVGWIAFVVLVRQMKNLISKILGFKFSIIFLSLVIPIIALGVMLGLVNRWNSWEVFTDPGGVWQGIIMYFSEPSYFTNWLLYTLFFYILYFAGDRLIKNYKL